MLGGQTERAITLISPLAKTIFRDTQTTAFLCRSCQQFSRISLPGQETRPSAPATFGHPSAECNFARITPGNSPIFILNISPSLVIWIMLTMPIIRITVDFVLSGRLEDLGINCLEQFMNMPVCIFAVCGGASVHRGRGVRRE